MSDTESFDSVMAEMGEKVASPYWKDMYARLQRAHEREIVEALCDACDQCDRIDRKAYEHEIEHVRKAEYAEDKLIKILEGKDGNDDNDHAHAHGCDYGHHRCDQHQVSYDELGGERHKAVCELRKLRERNAKNIWNTEINIALGLGFDAGNKDLCDRLIHLLGEDEPDLQMTPKAEESGVESARKMTKSAEIGKSGVDSTSDQSCGSSPMRQENETRITDELREFATDPLLGYASQESHAERITAIADRIDEQFDRICEQQEKVLQQTIDSMCEKLERQRDHWHQQVTDMMNRADAMEHERDNLFDLLRDAAWEYEDKHHWAKFWHDRAEDMRMKRDELQEKCDRLKAKVEHQREQLAVYATMYDFDAIRALKRERNEHKHRADNSEGHVKSLERRLDAAHETYCALLNDAAREFRALTAERDELRRSLRQIAERAGVPHDEDLSEYSDETVIGATLAQIDSTRGYVGALEWQRDRQKKMLDGYDKTHVELPKDANGCYWRIGDESESGRVIGILYGINRTLIEVSTGNGAKWTHGTSIKHKPPVTVGQVIRDITLGKITEAQAIERIEGINGSY